MNKENLLVLADYLESLPEDYSHFEMADFIRGGDMKKHAIYAAENGGVYETCGAVACAVGHGPSAGFLFQPCELVMSGGWSDDDEWVDFVKPAWNDYMERVFGIRNEVFGEHAPLFEWMFGSSWTNYDNHHWGAAARIRYAVDKEGYPEFFRYPDSQWIGEYEFYRKVSG